MENINAIKERFISIGLKHFVFNVLSPINAITAKFTSGGKILIISMLKHPKDS